MTTTIDEKTKLKLKLKLGQMIKTIRSNKGMSQRGLAREIGLCNSNLKYIEDGVNAPSPDVYTKIIRILKPSDKDIALMDSLYSEIRGTPPPDVCEFLMKNKSLYKEIKKHNIKLRKEQIERIIYILQTD